VRVRVRVRVRRFMADNAWHIARVGFGVTSLILFGITVSPYVASMFRLAPTYIKYDGGYAVRLRTGGTSSHDGLRPCRLC